jgi:hypothetical protein
MEYKTEMNVDNAFDELGIKTDTSNQKVADEASKDESLRVIVTSTNDRPAQKLVVRLTDDDRDLAVRTNLIPSAYRNVSFDVDRIRENLKVQYKRFNGTYVIKKLSDYTTTCTEILSAIRMHQLPRRSYLIGAPNGFGKSSFVYESLITLQKQGFKVAPYISLWELAQIRVENEQRLMNPYRKFKDESTGYEYTEPNRTVGYMKKPEIVTGRYSYSEYINADCLFVSFTDVISKDIESHTLYQLLSIRGAKGLPTIVTMSTSLEPYEVDRNLREQVWDEIKAEKEDKGLYDRVYHVSCYKQRLNMKLEEKDEVIDKETGVVSNKKR